MEVKYSSSVSVTLTRSARAFARELDRISRTARANAVADDVDPFLREEYEYLCFDESARIREALVATFDTP